jgi:hypothetical protein
MGWKNRNENKHCDRHGAQILTGENHERHATAKDTYSQRTHVIPGKGFSTGGNQGGQSIESNQTTAGAQLKNNHTNPFKNNRRDGVTEPATQNTQKDGAHWTQTRTAATE